MYGSVPRAVASVTHPEARSLPLAVLIRRVFPYTQSRTDPDHFSIAYLFAPSAFHESVHLQNLKLSKEREVIRGWERFSASLNDFAIFQPICECGR